MEMRISEIFDSIQGEGSFLGTPCTFIRTAGCPVKCAFCDSKYSWEKGVDMTIKQIVEQVHYKHVVITGGEPLIHVDLRLLVIALRLEGHFIMLETSGIRAIPDWFDHVVCSPKPNLHYRIPEGHIDELKYVVGPDFDFSVIPDLDIPIWLQPLDGTVENMRLCYEAAMKGGKWKVGVQLHKILKVD